MTEIGEKIHAYLTKSLEGIRHQLIHEQAEAALRFEVADERIEEREYDEQQRLRVDRVINRKVFRGEASDRYAAMIARLLANGIGAADLQIELRGRLDEDLKAVADPGSVDTDPGRSLQGYADVVPKEKWPALLCMMHDRDKAPEFRKYLAGLGFPVLESGLLERFGILKFACPPEHSFVRHVAGLPDADFLADALSPVTAPRPVMARAAMIESRSLLGVTRSMVEDYGKNVTLAILDTGIDRNHPAFAGMSADEYVDFTGTLDADTQGHGTHVASIAAGDDRSSDHRYAGIAPRCRLIVGKVLSADGTGSLEAILRGMAWAVFEKKADILSMSLGDSGTPANGRSIWSRACDEAFRNGTLVCVAAGNPYPSCPETVDVPGDSGTAVTVGAVDNAVRLANFSAQGSARRDSALFGKPNCVGPGVDVVAARSSQAHFSPTEIVDSLHVRMSGTSMATPAVAGCLALLKSKARSMGWEISPEDLKAVFYAACRPVWNTSGDRRCEAMEAGHGLVDMKLAFEEVERRLAVRGILTAAVPPAPSREPGPAPAEASLEPGLCYRCGKRYRSRAGTFSPAWRCSACGAPLCALCWQLGYRECGEAGHPAPIDSAKASARAGRSAISDSEKGNLPMAPVDPLNVPAMPDSVSGSTFLSRFDWKLKNLDNVVHPVTGEQYSLNRNVQAQAFRRDFGEVKQFAFESGLRKKIRLCLAAVRLAHAPGNDDVLRRVSGPDGLDFQDERFYCVGVFSPEPWPEQWKSHAAIRGNAAFYLVEKAGGTCWRVFGPKGPLQDLFDPESDEEKAARAAKDLAGCSRLVVPGDQVPLDDFLEEYALNRKAVECAARELSGRFQIMEHRGKSYIQRSILQEDSCQ